VALFRRSTPTDDAPAEPPTAAGRGALVIPSRGSGLATAESLPTVFACLSLIAHTATQARLGCVRGDDPTEVPEWLRRPEALNGGTRTRALVEQGVMALASRGLAPLYATPLGAMSWSVRLLDPKRVTVAFAAGAPDVRVWSIDGVPAPLADGPARRGGLLPVGFLFHPSIAEPLGPLQAARAMVAGFVDVETYASNVFRQGLAFGPRLEADADLPQSTAERWRDYWAEQHNDPNDPRIPVMGAGLRLATDLIDPETAAWVAARQYNATEVARLFGVPARRVSLPAGDSVTYATARDDDAAFMRSTMSAYTDPFADALTSLLPPGRNATEDVRVVFDWSTLLNPTPAEQVEYLAAAVAAGIMTVAEARTALGLSAVDVAALAAPVPVAVEGVPA
jgi:phage portal protein BeeE